MALLPGQSFDSSKHSDMNDFEPLPKGTYSAQIVKSEIKNTNAGTGKYIKLEIAVISGECKDRKIFANLNIENPNPQAVEIAQKELATLCRAVNVINLRDTNQLHGIPFMISVRIIADNRGGDHPPKNDITGYSAYSEKMAGPPAPATKTATTTSKTSQSSKPPWLQRENENKKEKLEAEKGEKEKADSGSKVVEKEGGQKKEKGAEGVLENKRQYNDGRDELVVESEKFDGDNQLIKDDIPY